MATETIFYYELTKRKLEWHPNQFLTAAVWQCALCSEPISGMGGPGSGELCRRCGDDILKNQLKYHRTPEEKNDEQ